MKWRAVLTANLDESGRVTTGIPWRGGTNPAGMVTWPIPLIGAEVLKGIWDDRSKSGVNVEGEDRCAWTTRSGL